MTDAHCHAVRGGVVRRFLCDPCGAAETCPGDVRFFGTHPWRAAEFNASALCAALEGNPHAGVGEIGLDRLHSREISREMRGAFEAQLEIAARYGRPVVLHGAKCWGETAKAAKRYAGAIPAFLFHAFSRSAGLLAEIESIGGFVSVGPAILNPRAENYRAMLKEVPLRMLLAESDATEETPEDAPGAAETCAALAALRGIATEEMEALLDANAARFVSSLVDLRGGKCQTSAMLGGSGSGPAEETAPEER